MKIPGIRPRVLLVAVLPVTLVAALLSVVVVTGRFGEIESNHRERAIAIAREVAATAEFGLFTGNAAMVQSRASAAARQPGVYGVAILKRDGAVVAHAGAPLAVGRLPAPGATLHELMNGARVVVQPVLATEVPLESWLDGGPPAAGENQGLLGYAAVALSLDDIKRSERSLLLAGLLVTVGGLLLGLLLAARMEKGQKVLERRITDATAELRSKKEEAELATLAKSRFLASASHDLRQPMHALGLFVARLEQLPHEPETHRLIGNVEASVRALQDLLDALLDISRLDAGVEKPQFEPVEVASLFAQMEREFASAAELKGIVLRVRPSPRWVKSDARLLYRMLLNLVSNAVRYTSRGGVLVACRVRGGCALIEVHDTGHGIPAGMQAEVFKEFVQLDNPERDRTKGLGLGLTIVERTAALLGHPLALRSEPGRGSRFRIEAPLEQAAVPNTLETASRPAELAGLSVLVIDDDTLARTAVVDLIESWGCRVHAAAGGEEARFIASNIGAPDAIACDFRLPGRQSAIDLIAQLRAGFGRPVPAFLISGDTDPAVLREAEASGLTVLHKPVRPARLRALIHRLVRPA